MYLRKVLVLLQTAPPAGDKVYYTRLWGHFSFEPAYSVSLQQAPREHIVQLWASLRQSGFFPSFRSLCVTTIKKPDPVSCYGSPVWVPRTTHVKYSRQSISAINERLPAPLLCCPEKNHDEIQAVSLTLRCANFFYEQQCVPRVLRTEDTAGANSPKPLKEETLWTHLLKICIPGRCIHDSQTFYEKYHLKYLFVWFVYDLEILSWKALESSIYPTPDDSKINGLWPHWEILPRTSPLTTGEEQSSLPPNQAMSSVLSPYPTGTNQFSGI